MLLRYARSPKNLTMSSVSIGPDLTPVHRRVIWIEILQGHNSLWPEEGSRSVDWSSPMVSLEDSIITVSSIVSTPPRINDKD